MSSQFRGLTEAATCQGGAFEASAMIPASIVTTKNSTKLRLMSDWSCLLGLRPNKVIWVARAARPDASLADLAGEVVGQRRLGLLDADGDPRTAVRSVFSWSYRRLDARVARAFRLAGLHPGPDFDPSMVAALTGAALEQGREVLDTLARAPDPARRARPVWHA